MKKFKHVTAVFLALCCTFAVCACAQTQTPPPDDNTVTDTQIDLVKDGKTEYSILLPESPTASEKFASQELGNFFAEATGSVLNVLEDNGSVASDGKYLAIGDTSLYRESGIEMDASELSDNGFKLVTYKNSVLMLGTGESGKVYAVYEFLRRQFNYRVYATDEIYIDTVTDCKLKDFNLTVIPDFEGRDVNAYAFFYDSTFAMRMRLNGVRTTFLPSQGSGSAWALDLWSHTTFHILPPAQYGSHTSWYSPDKTQLCFSNALEDTEDGKQMFQTFVDNLKVYIENEPNAKYFMIGQEDKATTCTCLKCKENNIRYGGENANCSGTLMVFMNKVAKEIKAWLQDEYPERADIVKLVTFAYQRTQQPPVTWNAETGKYEFVSEVIPEDNVVVRIAPLASVYSKNLLDEETNGPIREAILGWAALGVQLSIWTYHIGFGAYLYPMYNIHTIAENYRILREYGVVDILDQGPREMDSAPFEALRNFLHAELLWDADLDVNELIDEFMEHYFKAAAPYMREYLDLVNANYKLMEQTRGYLAYAGSDESARMARAEFYPKRYLDRILDIFDRAYAAIEQIEDEDERALVLERVETESLSPRYILLDLYSYYYNDSQLRTMIEEFRDDAERLGLTHYREDVQNPSEYKHTIKMKTDEWLRSLGN